MQKIIGSSPSPHRILNGLMLCQVLSYREPDGNSNLILSDNYFHWSHREIIETLISIP